jgi:DNA-binding response OmpR family regulator
VRHAERAARLSSSHAARGGLRRFNMKKILVVEDDDVERELVRMTLERDGYRVLVADNGARGFELAVEERPDLIVTDVWMPTADGVYLIRRVRSTPDIASTPILVTTGFGTGSASVSLGQGADAYEPKPLDPDSLRESVRRLLA